MQESVSSCIKLNILTRCIVLYMADVTQQPAPRVKYAVFGAGITGYNIIVELQKENAGLLVIDRDEQRVKELRDRHIDAIKKEFRDQGLLLGIPEFEIALSLIHISEPTRPY